MRRIGCFGVLATLSAWLLASVIRLRPPARSLAGFLVDGIPMDLAHQA